MMNMMTGAVAINGGVGVMEIRQPIAKNVAQAAEQMAADLAVNAHITLRELKTKINTVAEKKLPTFKTLMEKEPVAVAQTMVNGAKLTAYENGYAVYSFALYSDETMEAEDKAFLLKLRDTTMAAIDEARFSQVVGRLQESMAVPITGRVQDVVQLTAQSYGINAEEQEGILKYLIEGGDLSLYGLSNAVTRASQDVVSYDRATTLEGIGWQVATMEPQQWKQINQ